MRCTKRCERCPTSIASSHRSVVDEAAQTAREVALDRRHRGLDARPIGDIQRQGGHALRASRLLDQPRGSLVGCCERVHASLEVAESPTHSLGWNDMIGLWFHHAAVQMQLAVLRTNY